MSKIKALKFVTLPAVMAAVMVSAAFAKNAVMVKISNPAILNGTKIPAGSYMVAWQTHSPEATVTLADKNRVVVSTTGRWESRTIKYETNSVVYDTLADGTYVILEIRFAGKNGALVFPPSS